MQSAKIKDLFDEIKNRLIVLYDDRELESIARNYLLDRFQFDAIQLAMNRAVNYDRTLFEKDLIQFESGVPYQHIIGFTYFFGHKFITNPDALIPRPETEELVDWVIKNHKNGSPSILDIGTGTGCIPISLKCELSNSTCYGMDISEEALSLAQRNAKALNVEVAFVKADILKERLPDSTYDVIVSNPPYIPQAEKQFLHKNVTEHEPDIALFVADDDPIIFYRKIAKKALTSLKTGGTLYFEIHESFGKEVLQMLESFEFQNIELTKDLQNKDRMIRASKPKD